MFLKWRPIPATSDAKCAFTALGSNECAASVIRMWHQSRRNWWPDECFSIDSQDFECTKDWQHVKNKALVCFLLESDCHHYVAKALGFLTNATLKSMMNQLKEHKLRFDTRIDFLLNAVMNPVPIAPLDSADPKSNVKSLDTTCTLTETHDVNYINLAEDYPIYLGVTAPVMWPTKSTKKVPERENNLNLYQMPMLERLSKRYEVPKSPRKWQAETSLSSVISDSEDEIVCELVNFKRKKKRSGSFYTQAGVGSRYNEWRKSCPRYASVKDDRRCDSSSSEDETYFVRTQLPPPDFDGLTQRFRHTSQPLVEEVTNDDSLSRMPGKSNS